MMAQVTAAPLVSENKTIAVPAASDSIPTSPIKKTTSAWRPRRTALGRMVDNAAAVIGIELLAGARHRLPPAGPILGQPDRFTRPFAATALLRADRYVAPDIRRRSLGSNRELLGAGATDFAVEGRRINPFAAATQRPAPATRTGAPTGIRTLGQYFAVSPTK